MWILYCLIILSGKPTAISYPFETQIQCEEAKAYMMKRIASDLGRHKASLGCFKIDKPATFT
jgi:hypothetical protein